MIKKLLFKVFGIKSFEQYVTELSDKHEAMGKSLEQGASNIKHFSEQLNSIPNSPDKEVLEQRLAELVAKQRDLEKQHKENTVAVVVLKTTLETERKYE